MPDRRLLHRARSARAAVVASTTLGTVTALLLAAQAWLLASILARGFAGDGLDPVRGALIALLVVGARPCGGGVVVGGDRGTLLGAA